MTWDEYIAKGFTLSNSGFSYERIARTPDAAAWLIVP
jgi:hypothetical protein